jgi:hypothetical protein
MSLLTRYLRDRIDPQGNDEHYTEMAKEVRRIVEMEQGFARREPYVGVGKDGCLRSAEIDRTEKDGLYPEDAMHDYLDDSIRRWEKQASEIEDR